MTWLAPFATQILALDESTLDKVGRYLPDLRQAVTHSTAGVLAGRLSALFDLRLQQWVRVDILPGARNQLQGPCSSDASACCTLEHSFSPREKVRHAYRRTKPHPLLS